MATCSASFQPGHLLERFQQPFKLAESLGLDELDVAATGVQSCEQYLPRNDSPFEPPPEGQHSSLNLDFAQPFHWPNILQLEERFKEPSR